MLIRVNDNFEVLTKEFKIDDKTYLYLLKENAWIFGHKKELINDNINGIKEYVMLSKD